MCATASGMASDHGDILREMRFTQTFFYFIECIRQFTNGLITERRFRICCFLGNIQNISGKRGIYKGEHKLNYFPNAVNIRHDCNGLTKCKLRSLKRVISQMIEVISIVGNK